MSLSPSQIAMLEFYAERGPTAQTDARGTLNTWRSLIARGLLCRTAGLGPIDTAITDAGLGALAEAKSA